MPAPLKQLKKPDRIFIPYEKHWQRAARSPYPVLLKILILRALYREIHAKSIQLPMLKIFAEKIDHLKNARITDEPLLVLLDPSYRIKPETTGFPELPRPIRELSLILDKPDQVWERRIVAEALKSGFLFWNITVELQASHAFSFHEKIIKQLWPKGDVLAVETLPGSFQSDPTRWRGRWWVITDPAFTSLKKLRLPARAKITTERRM